MIEETKQGMKVEKKRDMKAAKQKKRQRREEERKKRKNYSPRIKIATLTINFTPGNVQKKLSGVRGLPESLWTLRGSVALSEKSSLNLAGEPQKSWKSWLSGFRPKWVPTWRTSDMQNSSCREATDLRLSPSDPSWYKVSRKIRESENKLADLEKSWINHLK